MKRRTFVTGMTALAGVSALPWRHALAADGTPKPGGTLIVAYASDMHSGRFTLNRESPPGYETFWVQDSIAEMVWGPAGRVITNLEFRKRLLELPGWEQFINLCRFFVHFQYKVEHEVAKTIPALRELIDKVDQLFVQESLRGTSV